MELLKNQGAHTELISIGPYLIQINNINHAILAAGSEFNVHRDEYRRSTSYRHRLQPDYSYCQGQE